MLKRRYDLIPNLVEFPQNVVAGLGSFALSSSWLIERAEEREPVRVSF